MGRIDDTNECRVSKNRDSHASLIPVADGRRSIDGDSCRSHTSRNTPEREAVACRQIEVSLPESRARIRVRRLHPASGDARADRTDGDIGTGKRSCAARCSTSSIGDLQHVHPGPFASREDFLKTLLVDLASCRRGSERGPDGWCIPAN